MSRRSKNPNRRTMPPLPAAGVRPMAPDEPSTQEGPRPGVAPSTTQAGAGGGVGAGAGPAANPNPGAPGAPKSNPINMALLELQEDTPEAEAAATPAAAAPADRARPS